MWFWIKTRVQAVLLGGLFASTCLHVSCGDGIRGHTAVKVADSVRPADLVKHDKLSVKVG